MNKKIKVVLANLLFIYTIAVNASVPVWTFSPLTDTTVSVADNTTATVQYQVTNQSSRTKQLTMLPIEGITSNGICNLSPKGQTGSTCLLELTITGANLAAGGVFGGPVLCQINLDNSPNHNQCYQPTAPNSLNISKGNSAFTVGGDVLGLQGHLVLQNNNIDTLTRTADGHFTFSTPLAAGDTYAVTVFSSPVNQTCTVSNGHGTISDANVTNIIVHCSTNTRTIGGNVTGLSGAMTLRNNNIDDLPISANGSYTFTTPVAQGSNYDVTIYQQPETQTCTVYNGDGTVGTSNITDVDVVCATNAYTVGGNITGLNGSVILRNNKSDVLISKNGGPFTFNNSVAEGALYDVEVLLQPSNQTCTVNHGSGTMGSGNVTNVAVGCTDNPTQLSTSVQELALSVTGLTVAPRVFSGKQRIITITNTGSSTAFNLTVTPPTWPTGTSSDSSNCPTNLAAGASCDITITPGAIATSTSGSSTPCTTSPGTAPNPGVITVSSDNTSSLSIDVMVLGYGCIYKGGYLFSVDDATPASGSIGGKVAATNDTPAQLWDANSTAVSGIDDMSTAGPNSCDGNNDGQCNTSRIIRTEGTAPSIALTCHNFSDQGFTDWYMPAICELGRYTGGESTDPGCPSNNPNLKINLYDNQIGNFPSRYYWSSTQYSGNPAQAFNYSMNLNGQLIEAFKNISHPTRCIRIFTPQS